MVKENYNAGDDVRVVVMEVQTSGGYAIPWGQSRTSWYGISGVPHARFDGLYFVGGSYGSCVANYNQYAYRIDYRFDHTDGSPVSIDGHYVINRDTMTLEATFTLEDVNPLESPRATIAILESGLSVPPYTVNDVVRAAYDEYVTLVTQGEYVTLSQEFDINPAWNLDNVECIAFIQKTIQNKEVYQANYLEFGTADVFVDDPVLSLPHFIDVAPNPFMPVQAGEAVVRMAMPEAGSRDVRLEMIDPSGRLVRTLSPSRTGETWTVSLDGRDEQGRPLGAGAYWLRMVGAGANESTRLVVVR
jgi:hypothetical protein